MRAVIAAAVLVGVGAAREAALDAAAERDAVRRAELRRPYTPGGPATGEVIPATALPVPVRPGVRP